MNRILKIVIPIIIIAAGSCFLPAITVLSASSRKNPRDERLSHAAAENGFCISYTHSVNKGRVHDYYICTKDGQLELYRTVFVSYGAGIPEPDETPGAEFRVLENGYEISGLHRNIGSLVMAVGLVAEHTIAFGKDVEAAQEYHLDMFFRPQTSIRLKTKRISLLTYLRKKNSFIEFTQ